VRNVGTFGQKTKMEPYYQDKWVKIFHGDCLEILPTLGTSADLILVDPPYGIDYREWDKFDDFLGFTDKWVKECFRILKYTGSFYSFMGWSNVSEFKLLLDKYGTIHNWITWHRTKGRGSKQNYKSMKEEILYYTKSNQYTWNEQLMLKKHIFPYVKNGQPRGWFTNEEGVKCRWTGLGNVWFYTVPFWKMPEYAGHPAQKPVMMYERMILSSTNVDDLIIDPFAGSGTTGIASINLKRMSILIEKEEKYCEVAAKRCQLVVIELNI
jgi:DNA modification methylase